jgi:hypothetical protein
MHRFVDYGAPRSLNDCLLLECIVSPSKMELTFFCNYPVVYGKEGVKKYLSENFGDVTDVSAFIGGMEKNQVERIVRDFKKHLSETTKEMHTLGNDITCLESSILNGGSTKASIHLCDTGKKGNVEKVYVSSKYYDF